MDDTNYSPVNPALPVAQTPKDRVAQELQQAVQESHQILVTASTKFPFTLFPDTVTVDRESVTITHRTFFKVAEVITMRIEDILNVTANVGPLMGSIKITTRFFDLQKPYVVNYFSRDDALRLKRIIQGYTIATQKKIDCSALSTKELRDTLNELGQGALQNET